MYEEKSCYEICEKKREYFVEKILLATRPGLKMASQLWLVLLNFFPQFFYVSFLTLSILLNSLWLSISLIRLFLFFLLIFYIKTEFRAKLFIYALKFEQHEHFWGIQLCQQHIYNSAIFIL